MSDPQRRFYLEAYPHGPAAPTADGLLRYLRRFEVHRLDTVVAKLPSGGSLLDVGCGDGALLSKCASRFQRLVGVDVADTQVVRSRRRLRADNIHNATLVHANLDNGLPFRDEQFDAATAVAVLGFIFDPIAALDELRRVLKPGGHLAVEVLNLVYLPRRLALVSGRLPQQTTCHGWEGGHLHNFTRAALLKLLRERGFHVRSCTGSGVFQPMRTWWPSMLLGNVIAVCVKA
jgi:ubiquinone/menaquinone biosynthesis C-methylase UbiE